MQIRPGVTVIALVGLLSAGPAAEGRERGRMSTALETTAAAFSTLPGWAEDDHAAAFGTFQRSCRTIKRAGPLMPVCAEALRRLAAPSRGEARAFFERHFVPHRVDSGSEGFLTGYYEPELEGSRQRGPGFSIPVYRTPSDLVTFGRGADRGKLPADFTGGRRTSRGLAPYATRAEIEQNGLATAEPILYLADPVESFFMHVQGSGRVRLRDGTHTRVSFAAKNGHPYTSIGKLLIARGEIAQEDISMDAVKAWIRAHPKEGRDLLRQNRSYIFFRELKGADAEKGPVGGAGCILTPGRSLAVDASFHALGTPIWVDSPTLTFAGPPHFRRLMIAQDVGSAIKGRERGDVFWGMGKAAGERAGKTRHPGSFTVLLPRAGAR